MKFVSHVKSNLRAGVDVELGPKTLIVGPNASGKSSLVNAVELALTGKVSDVFGRTMTETSRLAHHLGSGDTLWAEAEIDGQLVRWESSGKGKASGRHAFDAAILDPETAFPLRPLRDAVLGSPETMRKFFLQHAAGAASMASVEAMIPESLRGHFKRALASHSWTRGTPAVDMLLAVLEHAKKSAREAGARVKAAREAGNLQGQGLAPPPTVDQLALARSQLEAARAQLEAAVGGQARAQHTAGAAGQLAEAASMEREARARFEELTGEYNAEKAWLDAHPAPAGLAPQVGHLVAVLDWHVEIGATECRTCGTVFARDGAEARLYEDNLGDPRAFAPPFAERAARAHAGVDAAMASAQEHARHVAAAQALVARARDIAAEVKRAAATASALRSVVEDDSTDDVDGAVDAARAEVARLDAVLRTMEAAAGSWTASKRSIELALSEEREQAAWDQLAEECVGAVGRLLDSGVAGFVARVQAALPPSDVFDLRLREGTRGACDFGFVREGELHTALSGAEWARETCAMAAACMLADERVHVLVPLPAEFDADTLARVMGSFLTVDAQVLITAPLWPARVIHGWTVIDRPAPLRVALGESPILR